MFLEVLATFGSIHCNLQRSAGSPGRKIIGFVCCLRFLCVLFVFVIVVVSLRCWLLLAAFMGIYKAFERTKCESKLGWRLAGGIPGQTSLDLFMLFRLFQGFVCYFLCVVVLWLLSLRFWLLLAAFVVIYKAFDRARCESKLDRRLAEDPGPKTLGCFVLVLL